MPTARWSVSAGHAPGISGPHRICDSACGSVSRSRLGARHPAPPALPRVLYHACSDRNLSRDMSTVIRPRTRGAISSTVVRLLDRIDKGRLAPGGTTGRVVCARRRFRAEGIKPLVKGARVARVPRLCRDRARPPALSARDRRPPRLRAGSSPRPVRARKQYTHVPCDNTKLQITESAHRRHARLTLITDGASKTRSIVSFLSRPVASAPAPAARVSLRSRTAKNLPHALTVSRPLDPRHRLRSSYSGNYVFKVNCLRILTITNGPSAAGRDVT
ncbi:hypothetical protein EVAR_67578_1 [Eumeta japonica]|uniref:Uncharacterized protein n=1 Tax=Eumeta variegata TaxID=151549 RepID=A0A4C2A2J5_EUMVA|nr:hypothetical protein EVAR_67578_1 [Eumeta japonica]